MEKFMMIFHGGLDVNSSPEQMQENMGKWMAWVDKLMKDNRYASGEALMPGGKLVSGNSTVTEGPYTEGKEIVGGFFVVNAKDYDDAISLCADYPDYQHGGKVQVRQAVKFDM
ncbi:MAG: hypothetical protein H7Y31_06940 [Chitinophagaceae bacterium]|nr:hypothetical protein [Chitinophagaceae bacterium]